MVEVFIKDGKAELKGETPFIVTAPALKTKSGVKRTSKYTADAIKLINISEVTIIPTEDATSMILPDDIECMAKSDGLYCIQKDFDGSNLKIDLKTRRGIRVTPPPNWRALEIQRTAKGKSLPERKMAFNRAGREK